MTDPTNPFQTDSDLIAYRDMALLQIESSLEQEWREIVAQANRRLDAITQNFRESGSVADKNHDDLFFELEFENDWAINDAPESAIRITLLQLLQVSTARVQSGSQDADSHHIHALIEHAFIEQEGLRIISDLWQVTGNGDFTEKHFTLLDAATRPYLSEHGKQALDRIANRASSPTLKTASSALSHELTSGK